MHVYSKNETTNNTEYFTYTNSYKISHVITSILKCLKSGILSIHML